MNTLAWLLLGALIGAAAVLNAQDYTRRMRALNALQKTIQPPAPAAKPQPVPGSTGPGGQAAPPSAPPGPGLYGRCVMTCNFYDTGITVTYDHTRMRRLIDVPPADEWDGWAKEASDDQR